jgi:hypothetical protein
MSTNPTLPTDDYSRKLIEETIRPELETYLEAEFNDPHASKRGTSHPEGPGDWPPLVVTELPGGGRVLYPHVVISEDSDSSSTPDRRREFSQHDFGVGVELHGQTGTQMFNLRGLARAWFLDNRDLLRNAGFAEIDVDGGSMDWDSTSETRSWELTVTGLLHTHPDA